MRTAIASVLALALCGLLGYMVWRGIRAVRHKPRGRRDPSWPVLIALLVALFIGIGVIAPKEESESTADNTTAATTTATPGETATATPRAEPTPTAAQRRRDARLRREAAARERAERRAKARARARARARTRARERAERRAKARARARARDRARAREVRRDQALQREREENTARLQDGVTCDELGETDIPVIPGSDIDADNDGVGCES